MDFKTLQQIVASIIKTIQTTAVQVVRELESHTYKAEVTNPQKTIEVSNELRVKGGVKVLNQKDLEKQIVSLIRQVKALETSLAPRKKIMVDNFPKFPEFPKFPKIPEHPKSVEVNNLEVIVTAVNLLDKTIKALELDPVIKVAAPIIPETVVNVPKQPAPVVNVEKPDLSQIKKLVEFFESLSAKNPLPTRLTDGKAFYKAVDRLADVVTSNNSSDFMDSRGNEARATVNGHNELQVTTADTWGLNHSEEIDTTTYLGKQSVDGEYRIMKIVDDGAGLKTLTYASVRNNPEVDNYADAWTDRATLNYGLIVDAF